VQPCSEKRRAEKKKTKKKRQKGRTVWTHSLTMAAGDESQQLAMMAQLRDAVKDTKDTDGFIDDVVLRRYLTAHNWALAESTTALRASLEWR
jgi:hypothetical protein